jgi:hypothetical protein
MENEENETVEEGPQVGEVREPQLFDQEAVKEPEPSPEEEKDEAPNS